MLAGVYAHLYWMAYDFPSLRWVPGWDQDPVGIALLHALYILPAIGVVALIITIFHRKLGVSLALALPALIYAIISGACFAYFNNSHRPPQWLRDVFDRYDDPAWSLLFWATFILTIWACVNQFRKKKNN